MMRRSIGILRLVSSRASSSTVMPRGAVAVESVKAGPRAATPKPTPAKATASDDSCGTAPAADDDLSDMVPMIDPMNGEWGGPTKGGTVKEPTRFGDWERKGRCTDF